MRAAVFLDRDDTLMRSNDLVPPPPPAVVGDVVDPDVVELLPGAGEACARLKSAGFVLVIVTNQGCVARGAATEEQVRAVNDALVRLLNANAGWFLTARGGSEEDLERSRAVIDAVYFCPFHPKGNVPRYTVDHDWRKPKPGMIVAAAAEHGLDLSRSWMIGDAARDMEAGVAAGIDGSRCLRVGPEGGFRGVLEAAQHVLDSGLVENRA